MITPSKHSKWPSARTAQPSLGQPSSSTALRETSHGGPYANYLSKAA